MVRLSDNIIVIWLCILTLKNRDYISSSSSQIVINWFCWYGLCSGHTHTVGLTMQTTRGHPKLRDDNNSRVNEEYTNIMSYMIGLRLWTSLMTMPFCATHSQMQD